MLLISGFLGFFSTDSGPAFPEFSGQDNRLFHRSGSLVRVAVRAGQRVPKYATFGSLELQWLQDEGIALGVVDTHRYRAILGRDHENARLAAVSVEVVGIHEVVDKEGQLMQASAAPD